MFAAFSGLFSAYFSTHAKKKRNEASARHAIINLVPRAFFTKALGTRLRGVSKPNVQFSRSNSSLWGSLWTQADFLLLFYAVKLTTKRRSRQRSIWFPCTCNSAQYIMRVSNMSAKSFKLFPSCNGNKPKHKQPNTLQITGGVLRTLRSGMQIIEETVEKSNISRNRLEPWIAKTSFPWARFIRHLLHSIPNALNSKNLPIFLVYFWLLQIKRA